MQREPAPLRSLCVCRGGGDFGITASGCGSPAWGSGPLTTPRSLLQSELEGFSHFHLYVCAAFLGRWRKEILEEREFQVSPCPLGELWARSCAGRCRDLEFTGLFVPELWAGHLRFMADLLPLESSSQPGKHGGHGHRGASCATPCRDAAVSQASGGPSSQGPRAAAGL